MRKWLALVCAALLLGIGAAETSGRELSGFFGGDIAQAAGEIGGLTFSEGEEYAQNYTGDALCLRGNGGRVAFIELRDFPGDDTLCGVRVGMSRSDVEALMAGNPILWRYDEEMGFTIRADAENELNDERLVVFFDEHGDVNGAWYRGA